MTKDSYWMPMSAVTALLETTASALRGSSEVLPGAGVSQCTEIANIALPQNWYANVMDYLDNAALACDKAAGIADRANRAFRDQADALSGAKSAFARVRGSS